MSAALHNIIIEQGVSYGMSIQYADSGNIPIDLASFSCARMQWNANNGQSYQFTTNNTNYSQYYFTLESPTSSGIIQFKLPASVTAGYDFTSANYDLELESISEFYPSGGPQVMRLIQGTVTILPEITKISCSGI